jgi:hypothetical protein
MGPSGPTPASISVDASAGINALAVTSKAARLQRSPGAITRRPQVGHGLSVDKQTLFVDTHVLPIADVRSYSASGLSEKDLSTAFATIAIFSGVAAIYVFGVLELGWRTRSLLEGLLFGAIAMCAVAELFSARRLTLYTFNIVMKTRAEVKFVTADRLAALEIKAVLDDALDIA